MRGYLSDDIVANWLGQLMSTAAYASLHFDAPNFADPTASEVFDSGYSRASIAWQFVSARSIASTSPITFNVGLGTPIVAVGFHKALTDLDMICYAEPPLNASLRIDNVGRLVFSTGEIVLGFL